MSIPPFTSPVSLDLTGRAALVTGAGSGIGRACALRLAAAGAHVHILDRDAESARSTAKECDGTAHVVDLADSDALEQALTRGDIVPDIVVNNAGVQVVAPIPEFDPDDFRRIMAVMVEAPFRILRRALPHMYANAWGRVVNISSVHGVRASPFKSAYVAAKHALEGLSKVTALEGAPHGVTSNCVDPAYVRTPLMENQISDQAALHGLSPDAVVRDVMLERTAIKRLIEPAEVAEFALFLCTDAASFISGASLPMDGAWTAR
ncbi:3-hydroxybutyrate dehydrogenase [Streptomyces sp. SID3343]|uniref:3-hydroxybutyrate dehydrogenase n=1 Tax=Streptomyces sp. SID3343 TaxID=2690260 RepID=UPI00136D1A6E|nr:3-hydroxybutyrate dehydrogenase [Streptomyces sp. SID3343]MYV97697.1 SDR family oxidoreductase [Streptomyces sp. SID3343]